MKRTTLCCLVYCIVSFNSIAQQKKESYNSLLWRISGNQLTAPSYLFGTMHLTDKRIFHFSDSLYHFLEKTDGYAAELDMNAITSEIVNQIENAGDEERRIVKIVRPEWLKPYKSKLEKKLNKKLDSITISDLSQYKSSFITQQLSKGEMPTIIDVYLFDIARRQGKWVGGIEDYEDQFDMFTEEEEIMSKVSTITYNSSEMRRELEKMIKTYIAQDLDAIDVTSAAWNGAEHKILFKRNIKMTRRIDSIMKLRTCLFAVGAAHIPGDSGLVQLLRKQGYRVEPVYSKISIAPEKYSYSGKKLPWVPAVDSSSWYTVSMPGKPEPLHQKETWGAEPLMYYDAATMNAYFHFYSPISKSAKDQQDSSFFERMIRAFGKKGQVISQKSIAVNGNTGKEVMLKSNDYNMRIQVFQRGSALLANIMASYKTDSLYGSDANHFFESFHIRREPPVVADPDWATYKFPQHGFSIRFPAAYELEPRDKKADSLWRTNMYTSRDLKNNVSCWMMVMESQSGYYSDSDTAYFERVKQNLIESLNGNVVESVTGKFNGFPSANFTLHAKYDEEDLKMLGKVINRGNRRYYFYAIYTDEDSNQAVANRYINSFEFLPLPAIQWSMQNSPEKDFKLYAPAPILHQKDDFGSDLPLDFIIYDSITPVTIIGSKQFISPYAWWKNDSSFFRQQTDRYVGETDSLIEYQYKNDGATSYAIVTVQPFDNHNLKKMRLMMNNDTLYTIYCFLPKTTLATKEFKRLFEEVQFSKEKKSNYHLQNKTIRILEDMATGDSASFEAAVNSLSTAEFEKSDLNALNKALLLPYRDFDPNEFCAHDKLINKVVDVDDGRTVNFIRKEYPLLNERNKVLQYSFLSLLLRLKTRESFGLFKEIVLRKLPENGNPQMLQYGLNDSLELTATLFPEILQLSADTGFIKALPVATNKLLDSGLIRLAYLSPYKKHFYSYADRVAKQMQKGKEEYNLASYSLIRLLSKFKEPAAYQLLHQYTRLESAPEVQKEATVALVKNGQAVSPGLLEKLAANKSLRIELYDTLKSLGKAKLFPAKYLTQKYFAESEIYVYASDEYDPSKVEWLGEYTARFRNKDERFYLFKVTFDYEDGGNVSYLGAVGPYLKQPAKLVTSSKVAGIYTDEEYDSKKTKKQLTELLRQWEEFLQDDKL